MPGEIFNPNPTIFSTKPTARKSDLLNQSLWINEKVVQEDNPDEPDPIDQDEIFDLIRSIDDPEHPNTLEELRVVSAPQVNVKGNHVLVEFTPTIPHCGMSTLIGALPDRYKVDILLKPGSHQSELAGMHIPNAVAAALENQALLDTVEQCLAGAGRRGHLE
ncbi:FAM96B protein [Lyophyllum atratum]|nr:FAM96B protein [Lyophyllum atratum]